MSKNKSAKGPSHSNLSPLSLLEVGENSVHAYARVGLSWCLGFRNQPAKRSSCNSLRHTPLVLEALENRWVPASLSVTSIVNSLYNDNTGGLFGTSGSQLTITGSGFDSNANAFFHPADNSGDVGLNNINVVNDTTLTADYSSRIKAETIYVKVKNPNGVTSNTDISFEIKAPEVTSVSPNSGSVSGGDLITIKGNYLGGAKSIPVFFGSNDEAPAAYPEAGGTDKALTVKTVQNQPTGTIDLLVMVQGVKSAPNEKAKFTYTQADFSLTGFAPNFTSQPGQQVTISGTKLDKVTKVEFLSYPDGKSLFSASIVHKSAASLLVGLPPDLVSTLGKYTIKLSDAGNSVQSNTLFNSVAAPALPVTQVIAPSLGDTDTIAQILSAQKNTLSVNSIGDFPTSGDLFIQTSNGVAVVNFTGTTVTQSGDNLVSQFSGVTLYNNSTNPLPDKYKSIGSFDSAGAGYLLPDGTHAAVFLATTNTFDLQFHQFTGRNDIYFFADYDTATDAGVTPAHFTLVQAGDGFSWQQKTEADKDTLVPGYQLKTNVLHLPLAPTNSANIIVSKGKYDISYNATGGVPRPGVFDNNKEVNKHNYDFFEYTLNAAAADPDVQNATRNLVELTFNSSAVDQFSFPITFGAKSPEKVNGKLVPKMGVVDGSDGTFAYTRESIFQAYSDYLKVDSREVYKDTLVSDTSGGFLRITNPSNIVNNDKTHRLNWSFDQAIHSLFTAPPGGQLSINTGNTGGLEDATFIGKAGTSTIDGKVYQVLQFTSSDNSTIGTLNVYMPLFSDNKDGATDTSLYQSVVAPSWITAGDTSGFMTFANAGVFADGAVQVVDSSGTKLNQQQQYILGNIENQLVTALNRGVANTFSTTADWRNLANHYPTGATSNAYGAFMHLQVSGKPIFYGQDKPQYGYIYALAFDDQGDLSSTMTVVNDISSTFVNLGSWQPAMQPGDLGPGSSLFSIGNGQVRLISPLGASQDFSPFLGYEGPLSVNAFDRSGKGVADTIVVGVAGNADPHVVVLDALTGSIISTFYAFDKQYQGGITVAGGKVSIDGKDRDLIICGAGSGETPDVSVFDALTGEPLGAFHGMDPISYKGGVRVAMSERLADGQVYALVTSAVNNHVAVFDLDNLSPDRAKYSLLLETPSLSPVGLYVSAGDLDNDGKFDILAGWFDGKNWQGGVFLLEEDGKANLAKQLPTVPGTSGSPRVGLSDYNKDGKLDLIFAPGAGGLGKFSYYDFDTMSELTSVNADNIDPFSNFVATNFSRGKI